MKLANLSRRRVFAGFTLVEMLVGLGLGSIVMTMVAALSVYTSRAFYSMTNYVDLDVHSRSAVDIIGRELREATAVVSWNNTNSSNRSLSLTNVSSAAAITLTWSKDRGTLVLSKTGQPDQTLLTGCDKWATSLYTRAPNLGSSTLSFNTATNLTDCKLVNMSWKCSRTILGSKINTETVQTAQIVLRNKIK